MENNDNTIHVGKCTSKYTDVNIEYVLHSLNNIFNLLVITAAGVSKYDESYLHTLIGVTSNECANLMNNLESTYACKNEEGVKA